MAGRPMVKRTLAEIKRRGGGEYLREWVLEGNSISSLAKDLDVHAGSLRNMILRDPELTAAIDEARRAAAGPVGGRRMFGGAGGGGGGGAGGAKKKQQNALAAEFMARKSKKGGKLTRNDVDSVLDAENICCTLNGLYHTHGNQHVDNHTRLEHRQPHCESHELYKGILGGRSTGVFNGTIFVRPHAQKTNARQSSKNLLLSEEAVIETNPQLKIDADDVKCAHGATVGQLDEEALDRERHWHQHRDYRQD